MALYNSNLKLLKMSSCCGLFLGSNAFIFYLPGIVLVTDAIAAMGLGSGLHQLGTMTVEVKGNTARLPGKHTLAGR